MTFPIHDSLLTTESCNVRNHFAIGTHLLGRGQYGIVRRCKDRESKVWYAIKSVSKTQPDVEKIVLNEICMLRSVKGHPNILQIQNVYEDDRFYHIVTDLCRGETLSQRIYAKKDRIMGKFTEAQTIRIISSLLQTISYCHDIGVVHRDIKPENIMFLTKEEDLPIKLIDFGLARQIPIAGYMKSRAGTAKYIAPEVLQQKYTETCDIWSIGIITYLLLSGTVPFDGEVQDVIFDQIRIGRIDFSSSVWDGIRPQAKKFILCLLTYDTFKRPTALQALKHPWLHQKNHVTKPKAKKLSQPINFFNVFCGSMFRSKLHVVEAGR